MAATTRTYPWRFYVGPDGVVRSCTRCTAGEIEVALDKLHLTGLKAPAPVVSFPHTLTEGSRKLGQPVAV